jgi:hypothetical protein
MGTRRDDISSEQRAQISIEVLVSKREWGKVVELARSYEVSRKRFDAFYQIARQVDDCFALIDWQTGQLPDATVGINQLQALAEQLQAWSGRIYKKLSTNLKNWAQALFSYQLVLRQALQPLHIRYGDQAIMALARKWQLETDLKRRPWSHLEH